MPEEDGDPPGGGNSKGRKAAKKNDGIDDLDAAFYKPYLKPGYTRVFPVNSTGVEFTVFVENENGEKIGNSNPLVMANLFKNEIKGVINIKRINATKVGVVFAQAIEANAFLKNTDFLTKHAMKAYIPARAVESIGVLRFVPASISNEELFKKLSCKVEIVGVRRFTRKVNPFVHLEPLDGSIDGSKKGGKSFFGSINGAIQWIQVDEGV